MAAGSREDKLRVGKARGTLEGLLSLGEGQEENGIFSEPGSYDVTLTDSDSEFHHHGTRRTQLRLRVGVRVVSRPPAGRSPASPSHCHCHWHSGCQWQGAA